MYFGGQLHKLKFLNPIYPPECTSIKFLKHSVVEN